MFFSLFLGLCCLLLEPGFCFFFYLYRPLLPQHFLFFSLLFDLDLCCRVLPDFFFYLFLGLCRIPLEPHFLLFSLFVCLIVILGYTFSLHLELGLKDRSLLHFSFSCGIPLEPHFLLFSLFVCLIVILGYTFSLHLELGLKDRSLLHFSFSYTCRIKFSTKLKTEQNPLKCTHFEKLTCTTPLLCLRFKVHRWQMFHLYLLQTKFTVEVFLSTYSLFGYICRTSFTDPGNILLFCAIIPLV